MAPLDKHCQQIIFALLKNKNYDFVVFRYLSYAVEFGIHFDKKVIVDLDDLPEQFFRSVKEQIHNNIPKQVYFSILEKLNAFHTRKIVKSIRHAYVPLKTQSFSIPNTSYLPNIPYPVPLKNSQIVDNHEIMFIGSLSYGPNHEGIDHFLAYVWPSVVQKMPQAHFNIVGSNSTEERKQLWGSHERTTVIGFVENPEEVYAKNNIVVVPVYRGAGTNIKVLEAMYMGKACVIAPSAGKGFEDLLIDGVNIIIAKDDNEFALSIVRLLTDRDYCRKMGENAKHALTQEYSYEAFRKIVQNCIV
jgi:glycosyltransferase involved in cell wall biosynthesis